MNNANRVSESTQDLIELRRRLHKFVDAIKSPEGLQRIERTVRDVLWQQFQDASPLVTTAAAIATPATPAKPAVSTAKPASRTVKIHFDGPVPALELCEQILSAVDELPESAEEFGESIREKTESIQDWILVHNEATSMQMSALENMLGGVSRWLR